MRGLDATSPLLAEMEGFENSNNKPPIPIILYHFKSMSYFVSYISKKVLQVGYIKLRGLRYVLQYSTTKKTSQVRCLYNHYIFHFNFKYVFYYLDKFHDFHHTKLCNKFHFLYVQINAFFLLALMKKADHNTNSFH